MKQFVSVFALSLSVLTACGAHVVIESNPDSEDGNNNAGIGGDDGEAGGPDTTSAGGSDAVGGSSEGGSGGASNPECATDAECSVFDGECLVFVCLSSACFAHVRDDDGDGKGSCDGFGGAGSYDCNDQNPLIYPGADEICDDIDSDCDGTVSEGCASYCDPWNPTSEFGYQGCCGTFQQLSSASELQSGMIFKGDSIEVVYYFASNGTRYVFPTTMILDSWFGPYDADGIPISDGSVCNTVVEIPTADLANIPIGGNMTFRPGVFITGLTTDPNARYVVSGGGILHRLMPKELMDEIYPGTSQSRVRLSKDGFFVNFLIGGDITDAAEYDPSAEFNTTIEQNLGLAP